MNLQVEIDAHSGFCNGVIRAVNTAEKNLGNNALYSLGAIVHNSEELERLHNIGLTVIDIGQMKGMSNTTVLIRAHGEPPQTYKIAQENGITLIDCTCPVVLKLQEKIRDTYNSLKEIGNPSGDRGQIVIFGKEGHAEVNGLTGQVNGDAVILDVIHIDGIPEPFEKSDDACSLVKGVDKIDFNRPIYIFSQTTKDPKEYELVCRCIKERIANARGCSFGEAEKFLKVHDTICRQVAQRHKNLVEFARNHSVIVFVSGKESSNGKVLYELCRSVNRHSYHIQHAGQIDCGWFRENDSVGICGATSTPKWQLESVANYLQNL